MVREQAHALEELHAKVLAIRDSAQKVGEFANKLRSVEGDLVDAQASVDKILAPNAGMSQLSQALEEVKAKAVHEQYSLGLAKAAIDKLVPSAAGAAGAGPGAAFWAALAPA